MKIAYDFQAFLYKNGVSAFGFVGLYIIRGKE